MANFEPRTTEQREHLRGALRRVWAERYAGVRPFPHNPRLDRPAFTLPGLRGKRRAAGLSQPALAKLAGTSVGTIQDLERGSPTRNEPLARRLAEALDIGRDHLESPVATP